MMPTTTFSIQFISWLRPMTMLAIQPATASMISQPMMLTVDLLSDRDQQRCVASACQYRTGSVFVRSVGSGTSAMLDRADIHPC